MWLLSNQTHSCEDFRRGIGLKWPLCIDLKMTSEDHVTEHIGGRFVFWGVFTHIPKLWVQLSSGAHCDARDWSCARAPKQHGAAAAHI